MSFRAILSLVVKVATPASRCGNRAGLRLILCVGSHLPDLLATAAGAPPRQSHRDTRQALLGYVVQRSPRVQARGWPAVTTIVAR